MEKTVEDVSRRQVIIEYEVKESDIDDMGILYSGQYVLMFDLVRKFLFREYGYPDMNVWREEGWVLPNIRFSTRIYRMARVGDRLKLVSWVHAQKGVRLVLAMEAWSEDMSQKVAEGYCEGCFIDAKTYRPIRPSNDWRLIRGLREEEAQAAAGTDDGDEMEVIFRPPLRLTDPENCDNNTY